MSSYPFCMRHLTPLLFLLACTPHVGEAELSGVVRTAAGAPVAGASVELHTPYWKLRAGEEADSVTAVTGADGAYTLTVPAEGLQQYSVELTVGGDDEPTTSVTVHAGQRLTKDFEVGGTRRVALRCAGFPDESCRELADPVCALPDGRGASDDTEGVAPELEPGKVAHRTIRCPAGADVVVRLGGQEARVPAAEDVARLDFTGVGGGVTAQLAGDAPSCLVRASRPLLGLFLGRYADDSRYLRTPGGAPFQVAHLPPGPWVIQGTCYPDQTREVTVEVEGDVIDLGVLALE